MTRPVTLALLLLDCLGTPARGLAAEPRDAAPLAPPEDGRAPLPDDDGASPSGEGATPADYEAEPPPAHDETAAGDNEVEPPPEDELPPLTAPDVGRWSQRCGTLAHPTCSLFWLPLASVLVPGLGQAIDGQRSVPYFVAAGVGFGLGFYYQSVYDRRHPRGQVAFTPTTDMLLDRDGQAALLFGMLQQDVGFLSAYDVYRHRLQDELGVPTSHSSVSDLLAAPVHLEKLARPTVLVPLAILAAASIYSVRHDLSAGNNGGRALRAFEGYRATDAFTTGGLSYLAGTSEEAFFRGFVMSYLQHRWDWNPLLANALQGALFSLAHGVSDGAAGVAARAGLGWYLGWLALRRDYDLTDAVFIHAWWDVIAFTTTYAIERPRLGAGQTVMVAMPAIPF